MRYSIKPFDPTADHFQGSPESAIELIEYGNFQCVYCALAYPEIKYLQDALGNQFRIIFRNFPLPDQHPLAVPASIAAEAAGRQGKFWHFHDMIFENQSLLSLYTLRRFARSIELDMNRFDEDMKDVSLLQKVFSRLEEGLAAGIKKTPCFFINGKRYADFPDFTGLLTECFRYLKVPEMSEKSHPEFL